MKIENISTSKIIPYDNNPRKNDRAVGIVARSIKEFGFRVPIIIDKDNVILAGHTRLKAAVKLGIAEVPCIYAAHLTREQARAFRIMDNKSNEYAEWDFEVLLGEMDSLRQVGFNLDFTGFTVADFENIGKLMSKEPKEIDENIETVNECPKCKYKW